MGKKLWWGAASLATLGAMTFVIGGSDAAMPEAPPDQTMTTQMPGSAPTLVVARAATVPVRPAASAADGNADVGVDMGNTRRQATTSPEEMLQRAQDLRDADRTATLSQGPADACLTQMKMVFCPIIGSMPFFRDIAGQVAMWGNFDCPTGAKPPKI